MIRFGRKPTLISMSVGLIIFGIATSFASSIWVFIVLRWFVAFCCIAVFTTAYVYCKSLNNALLPWLIN